MTELVDLRRRLHRRPEIGLQTPHAQAAVLDALAGLDLRMRTGTALTSVVAVLDGGRPGPTVLLRADMDALPVQEETGLEFASEVAGVMHACGHDVHTAMLVGAARLLAARRSELAGRVVFAFQPGEEGAGGASLMIGEGLLDGVDRAFALHVTPSLPTGHLATGPGPVMASADVFTVEVTGRGGHGALPHEAVDPIAAACAIATRLPAAVRAVSGVWDPAVATVGRIAAGNAPNAVPGRAELAGTVRAVSEPTRAAALDRIRHVVAGCAAAHSTTAEVRFTQPCPVAVNDPDATRAVVEAAATADGVGAVHDLPHPVPASEDFAEVLGRVPGALAFLGAAAPGSTSGPVHSGRLLLDERVLGIGARLHAAVAMRLLHHAPPSTGGS